MDKIILIDKTPGITSYDAVRKIKKLCNTRKVGHCGTLDPFASGLLIVAINQGTKILSFLEHDYKEYEATICFGKLTDTYDLTGKVTEEKGIIFYDDDTINDALNAFKGKIRQTPPIYSAIHVDGKHLYDYARENKEVEIPEREVEIFDIRLLENNKSSIKIYVKCSRGTYIRTLGVDIAKKLNNLGYLSELRRISIGNISVNQADSYEDILNGKITYHDIKDVLPFRQIEVTDKRKLKDIYNGQSITLEGIKDDIVLLTDQGTACAIYDKAGKDSFHCLRGLFDEDIRYRRRKELQG